MRRVRGLLLILCLCVGLTGCTELKEEREILYQVSTIGALSKGVYDGETTYRDLKEHGNIGIGTFNGLDGEMVASEGKFYQFKTDGKVYSVDDSDKTPFAVVTFFETDKVKSINKKMDLEQVEKYIDRLIPTDNIFYAIRIRGEFDYIKTRSVPKQKKPYPSLDEVIKKQKTFEFHDQEGTIVGFKCPDYIEGVNVPGYHFHFISDDEKAGGHLLECEVKKARIEIDNTAEFFMVLPKDRPFYQVDLEKPDNNQ